MPLHNSQEMRRILYQLRARYKRAVAIYRPSGRIYNYDTAQLSENQNVFNTQAIVLPDRTHRDFVYDLAYIAANKNFTYGGLFDKSERNMLFLQQDVPRGFRLTLQDWIVFDGRRWDVKETVYDEDLRGQLVRVKNLESYEPFDDRTKLYPGFTDLESTEQTALDELVRKIKVLYDDDVPAGVSLWPMIGPYALWGNALTTTLTHTNRGVRGGYIGDGDAYLDLNRQIDIANVSVLAFGLDLEGSVLGVSDGSNSFTIEHDKVDAGAEILISGLGAKCIAVTASSNVKVYLDGTLDTTYSGARDVTPINLDVYALGFNMTGTPIGDLGTQIGTIFIGPALSDVDMGVLYGAVFEYNRKLGRV